MTAVTASPVEELSPPGLRSCSDLTASGRAMEPSHPIEFIAGEAPDVESFLTRQLDEFNARATGAYDAQSWSAVHRDPTGAIVAGASGFTWAGCAFVANLWVDESLRGQGLGRQLMAAAEAHARAEGCRIIFLTTHDFQAPGFYRRCGYEEVARVIDLPPGHVDFHFAKRLAGI